MNMKLILTPCSCECLMTATTRWWQCVDVIMSGEFAQLIKMFLLTWCYLLSSCPSSKLVIREPLIPSMGMFWQLLPADVNSFKIGTMFHLFIKVSDPSCSCLNETLLSDSYLGCLLILLLLILLPTSSPSWISFNAGHVAWNICTKPPEKLKT